MMIDAWLQLTDPEGWAHDRFRESQLSRTQCTNWGRRSWLPSCSRRRFLASSRWQGAVGSTGWSTSQVSTSQVCFGRSNCLPCGIGRRFLPYFERRFGRWASCRLLWRRRCLGGTLWRRIAGMCLTMLPSSTIATGQVLPSNWACREGNWMPLALVPQPKTYLHIIIVHHHHQKQNSSEWLTVEGWNKHVLTLPSGQTDSREFFNYASRSLSHGYRYTKHLISLPCNIIHHRPTLILEQVLHDKVKKTTMPQWPFWL